VFLQDSLKVVLSVSVFEEIKFLDDSISVSNPQKTIYKDEKFEQSS